MSAWAGWSYLLAAVGILGLYFAGRKMAVGWFIGLGAQVLWIAYALVTSQYGFILAALAYGTVYGINGVRWVRENRSVYPDGSDSGRRADDHR